VGVEFLDVGEIWWGVLVVFLATTSGRGGSGGSRLFVVLVTEETVLDGYVGFAADEYVWVFVVEVGEEVESEDYAAV
jgi:hypothetical protein